MCVHVHACMLSLSFTVSFSRVMGRVRGVGVWELYECLSGDGNKVCALLIEKQVLILNRQKFNELTALLNHCILLQMWNL